MLELVEQTVTTSISSRGVKRCFVISRTADNIQKNEDLPRVLVSVVREMGLALLDGTDERKTETLLDHVVVARRFGEIAVCVVGDGTLDEAEIQRKLNVLAIRIRVLASREPPNALGSALREAYVACTMPLSGRVFDRAIDDLKRTQRPLDPGTLRPLMEWLAQSLTPPSNELLLERSDKILRAAESVAPGRISRPPADPARAEKGPAQRAARTTIPVAAAVQQVVREFIGPLGDLMIQRALERIESDEHPGDATEHLVESIASQLPPHKRERFMTESRAAIQRSSGSSPPGAR